MPSLPTCTTQPLASLTYFKLRWIPTNDLQSPEDDHVCVPLEDFVFQLETPPVYHQALLKVEFELLVPTVIILDRFLVQEQEDVVVQSATIEHGSHLC